MSIEAAVGRIEQIMAMQRELQGGSPSGASSIQATAGTAAAGGSAGTTGAGSGGASFANALAAAQGTASAGTPGAGTPSTGTPGTGTSGTAGPTASGTTGAGAAAGSGYVNPLANASVRAERIDQGVDYAGSGTLGALGPAVVTNVVESGSGWEGGGYVEYKLTAGPDAGRSIFYAEGVTPTVQVGQTLAPGQPVATIIPGSAHGIEIGWAAGKGEAAYANVYGGGYSEGQRTAAGQAFSDLLASLGAPPGLAEGRPITGHFP
jgi:hypothetical protein